MCMNVLSVCMYVCLHLHVCIICVRMYNMCMNALSVFVSVCLCLNVFICVRMTLYDMCMNVLSVCVYLCPYLYVCICVRMYNIMCMNVCYCIICTVCHLPKCITLQQLVFHR